ncbi:MmgE/PrpD family protein [Verticiella sediminum]|uniref:MmgE/PrpD family protein n=1 Tax=Verticiella sediminum TaxID=1247510 RepID=A0A556AAY9_9BURK|nr:MmgE/PrpD family protein [Verticiella sediminum]TSH90050.1 MmgE/PrpD family protein [Verticiella sediminum]
MTATTLNANDKPKNEKTLTGAFADCLLDIRYDTLPAAAIEVARHVALDGLGVMIAGASEPLGLGRISIEYTREMGGNPQASVATAGFKTSMSNAAYVNGTLAHALDWDNTWYPLNHPTSPTLPAILAVAEHRKLPGHRIIEAIVAAFETQGRLRLAAGAAMKNGEGFHKPGMTGTFGAVAGVARLIGLDRQQTLMALGLAGSRAGSVALNTGTMTKSSHSGHAARIGVDCGLLAEKGWTATADIFGPKGFFDTFLHGGGTPALLVEGFAAPLRMVDPGVGFKKYPSNYFTHRPIDAALALRKAPGFRGSDIDRIDIDFPAFDYVDRPQPRTGLDGKFSVQYATVVALLDGEITIDSFTNERRFADDVQALLPRVTLRKDTSIPGDFDQTWAVVTVRLKDGRTCVQKMQELSGWIGYPLTREQRLEKFFGATRRALDQTRAQRVVDLVEKLDAIDDIDEVMTIVRA